MRQKNEERRINIRIREKDRDVQEFIDQLDPSVNLSDMARYCIITCIRLGHCDHLPRKNGEAPSLPAQALLTPPEPAESVEDPPAMVEAPETEAMPHSDTLPAGWNSSDLADLTASVENLG